MERLKDAQFELASLEAEASELLRGAEPYAVPSSLKRSVRVRLVEAAPRRRVPLWFRVAVVAAVLALVATAVAAVTRAWRKPNGLPVAATSARSASVLPVMAPIAVEPSAQVSLTGDLAAPSTAALPLAANKRGASEVHVDARRDPAPVSEASLVYETARALRNEGDPARAARVLDEYFKRYPHGALAEEAQALSIDIAVAQGDPRAKSLADRYLSVYPNGHFRAKAERVLGVQ